MAIIGDFYLGPEPAGENPKENSFGQSENEKQRMREELKNNNTAGDIFYGRAERTFWVPLFFGYFLWLSLVASSTWMKLLGIH